MYNLALSDKSGETELKLPVRSDSIFKDNIEVYRSIGETSRDAIYKAIKSSI